MNESIKLTSNEALDILREVDYILISLRDIARHYHPSSNTESNEENMNYFRETTGFIDRNQITRRLSKARRILSEKFDQTLGEDNMDDIERALENTHYWEKPGD